MKATHKTDRAAVARAVAALEKSSARFSRIARSLAMARRERAKAEDALFRLTDAARRRGAL